MRKPLVSLLVGVFVVMVLALAPGRSAATPHEVRAASGMSLAIDADARDGNRPCDPVTYSANVTGRHEVAVCITDAPANLGGFTFELVYDDAKNSAQEPDCQDIPCLDDNPDANAGDHLGSGVPTADLGSGWSCNVGGLQPLGDADPDETGPGMGVAWLLCVNQGGPWTSHVGDGAYWPLAVVTFDVLQYATNDMLTLRNVELADPDAIELGSCYPTHQIGIPCAEAENIMTYLVPTDTPTPTDTSTPTPTPTCTGTVDLTGDWGYVYAMADGYTSGECTAGLDQDAGGNLNSTDFECGQGPPLVGELTGTVTCDTVIASIDFAPQMVYLEGTVSADGSTQSGKWGTVPSYEPNPYAASRLVYTPESSPPGSPITVTVDSGGRTIDVTFDAVDQGGAGGTAVISDSSAEGALPGQFQLLGLYFHVMTRALNSGQIEVCASYADADDDGYEDTTGDLETDLRILHYEDGSGFVELARSESTNTSTNKVCGKVNSLSEFALVGPIPAPGPVGGIAEYPQPEPDAVASTHDSSGTNALALAGLATGAIVLLAAAGWYARRRWLT